MNDPRRTASGTSPAGLDPELMEYIGSLLSDDLIRRSQQVEWTKSRLLLALAGLQRIRRLWGILFGRPWLSLRAQHDEMLYQQLRHGLLTQLQSQPEYRDLNESALELVPEELVPSDDLLAMDEEMFSYFEGRFQQLEARLIRRALADDVGLNVQAADAFFVVYDDELNQLEVAAEQAYDLSARELGLIPRTDGKTRESRTPANRRKGRAPTPLLYGHVQRIWWEMMDEYEERGEPRRPSQEDLCDRLVADGIQVAPRTFRSRLQVWRQEGLNWPPPRPDED